MKPVLKVLSAADVRQYQLVEAVFTCQGEQGSAHSNTQEQEEAREVTNPHLKSLRWWRHQPVIGLANRRSEKPDRKYVRQTRKCLPR